VGLFKFPDRLSYNTTFLIELKRGQNYEIPIDVIDNHNYNFLTAIFAIQFSEGANHEIRTVKIL